MTEKILQMVFLFGSILALAYLGILAKRRVKTSDDLLVGGRRFTRWDIFWSLFAFWGGNTISSIIELSFKDGIVGAWFAIARITMLLMIVFITGGAFRKLAMITLSSFVSRCFNAPVHKVIVGIIIAFNSIIFTVSSVVGAAAFFTAIMGWSIAISILVTVLSFLAYTALGGMHALSANGKVLTIGQLLALVILVVVGVWQAGWANIANLEPRHFDFLPESHVGTIMMWMFTFVLNAFVAQGALQIMMSCRELKEGQKGVFYVLSCLVPVTILSVIAGLAAKVLYPDINPIAAMPTLASNMPFAILSALVVMGMYFTTLGWASTSILYGGTVMANDVYRYFFPNASSEKLIQVSRISIVAMAFMTVGFAILIPSGIAFWSIVGFVVRNAGLFPLVMVGLFWNAMSRQGSILAVVAGSIVGMAWYLISYPQFLFGAHPMFVAMLTSMVIISVVTLMEFRGQWMWQNSPLGLIFLAAGVLLTAIAFGADIITSKNLTFPFVSYAACFYFAALLFMLKRRGPDGKPYVFELTLDD